MHCGALFEHFTDAKGFRMVFISGRFCLPGSRQGPCRSSTVASTTHGTFCESQCGDETPVIFEISCSVIFRVYYCLVAHPLCISWGVDDSQFVYKSSK
jgi:hypothetical protein